MRLTLIFATVLLLAVAAFYFLSPGGTLFKPISELRVRITGSTKIPEPTNIQSTGDWYFLDHISSGLASYDSTAKTFLPNIAQSWSVSQNGEHIFKLKDGIAFHDGIVSVIEKSPTRVVEKSPTLIDVQTNPLPMQWASFFC